MWRVANSKERFNQWIIYEYSIKYLCILIKIYLYIFEKWFSCQFCHEKNCEISMQQMLVKHVKNNNVKMEEKKRSMSLSDK